MIQLGRHFEGRTACPAFLGIEQSPIESRA